ncbi:MAG: hypothetical protein FWG12_04380 [Holophagaceae bacterium]|nr:hypothetical protein [Holophagaceae bacterium]
MLFFPPPQHQELPEEKNSVADRDIQIRGFNGINLGASVKQPIGLSRWFAVLVQDAGQTDRNGHNQTTPKVRTGLTLAELMQKNGIGSLRYDKRLVGAEGANLDLSLDAQLGDLSAVIAVAKGLPEARGKQILLLGHGEGALMSLLAASQADALIMLAPPSGTMAKTIKTHIEAQLPVPNKEINLAYLESIFQSIRDSKPMPLATTGVHAAIVQFGRSLMAPATLGFVKSTMDLDPWVIASRLPIPHATVWGDRDIITSKPQGFSELYGGAIIDVPNANHHFRIELRSKESLDGSTAVTTYSESVPLADLDSIFAWLQSVARGSSSTSQVQ